MSSFDSPEHAVEFFQPYATHLSQAVEQGFTNCDASDAHYQHNIIRRHIPFHGLHRSNSLHKCINDCLLVAFEDHPDVKMIEQKGGGVELLFQDQVRLKVNKANDDLSLCTNNNTVKEQAYRNPSGLGLVFGYNETAPLYLVYRQRKDGSLLDIKLLKYDSNERQWHVNLDGSNPDAVQFIGFDTPVTPVITPAELPEVRLKKLAG